MDELYMEQILDHYQDPRNFGTIEDADLSHEEGNPSCGDLVRVDIKLDGDKIADIKFSGKGCAISQASSSMLMERLEGGTLDDIKNLTKEDILDMLGIPIGPMRIKCALLSLKVVKVEAYGLDAWQAEDEDDV
jgi:nitrogen fixation NifU-like protein